MGTSSSAKASPWWWRVPLAGAVVGLAVGFGVLVEAEEATLAGPLLAGAFAALGFAVLLERDRNAADSAALARLAVALLVAGLVTGAWAGWARPALDGRVHWDAVLLAFVFLPILGVSTALQAVAGAQAFWPVLGFALSSAGGFYVSFGVRRGWLFDEVYFMTVGIGAAGAVIALALYALLRKVHVRPRPRAVPWGLGLVGALLAVATAFVLCQPL